MAIKQNHCICSGCGIDFSGCNDIALDMVFVRCHFHSRKCVNYKENGETFWACSRCNGRQKDTCGYWQMPNKLVDLKCESKFRYYNGECIQLDYGINKGGYIIKKAHIDNTYDLKRISKNEIGLFLNLYRIPSKYIRKGKR